MSHGSDGIVIRTLTKRYGDFIALAGVTADLPAGRITAVLGPNGAGKSTLLKVIGGSLRAESGEMCLLGHPYRPSTPAEAMRVGVVSIHQDLSLIDDWQVWEHFPKDHPGITIDQRAQRRRAADALAALGSGINVDASVRNLAASDRQLVEIAKAFARNAKALLVDEPTAGLDLDARDRVFAALRAAADQGCIVVIVTHDLRSALKYSDSVVLLRDGVLAFQRAAENVPLDSVIGQVSHDLHPSAGHDASFGHVILAAAIKAEAENGFLRFEVRAGSIVGIASHPLSRTHDLLRAIAGLPTQIEVSASLTGRQLTGGSAQRFRAGVVYVSRERSHEWIFPEHTVERNLNAASFPRLSWAGLMDTAKERENAENLRRGMGIVTTSLDQPIADLSGGNRQKCVIGRALSSRPAVLLLDEPFSGVDVTTRLRIGDILRKAALGGSAAVIFSREFDDVVRLCDEVVVFGSNDQKCTRVNPSDLTGDQLEAFTLQYH